MIPILIYSGYTKYSPLILSAYPSGVNDVDIELKFSNTSDKYCYYDQR